jgi:hypothetical protein
MNKVKTIVFFLVLIICNNCFEVFSQEKQANIKGGAKHSFYKVSYKNVEYDVLKILRKDGKTDSLQTRVDYFNCGLNNISVSERFVKFRQIHPNIIGYCSGSYVNGSPGNWMPEGLSIDHGVVVNRNLELNRLDALVIVYPNGGMAVNNLYNNAVTTSDGVFKIRNSDGRDKQSFIQWAQKNSATVFQTHLLAYNNELTINQNLNVDSERDRLFLIASKDKLSGETYLYLVRGVFPKSLFEASRDMLDLFKSKNAEISWMINLESGFHRSFNVYDQKGIEYKNLSEPNSLDDALNLLLFYYE